MKKQIKQVQQFQKKFKQPVGKTLGFIDYSRAKLRFNLMKEENEEYMEAVEEDNLVEIADALGDMLYILCGTIVEHGMQDVIVDVFDEIHRSNMSKLDKEGKPILRDDGKILKGADYFKPNINKIINTQKAFTIQRSSDNVDWKQYIEDLDKYLVGLGFRKYNKTIMKSEDFAYWKEYDNKYMIGLFVYDFTKYTTPPASNKVSIQFECVPIGVDCRCDLSVSKDIELPEFEAMAQTFYEAVIKHL